MSEVTITWNGHDVWAVWLQLEGGNPTNQGESFVIGSGSTRDEAITDAVADLEAVMALFPDGGGRVLHAFSGSLPAGPYVRLDCNPSLDPEVVGSVYDIGRHFLSAPFRLVIADPPYSSTDAEQYGTPMIDRNRATRALAQVTAPGGHLVWLDTCWPMHRKAEWLTVGRILVQRSTNHRARVLSIFERVP